jgi:hypothetical protein
MVNDFYLNAATSENHRRIKSSATESKPAKAIAIIPPEMIKPRMAFAMSHRSNSR